MDEDNFNYHQSSLEKRIHVFKETSMFKTLQIIWKFELYEVRNGISMLQIETDIRRLAMNANLTNLECVNIFFNMF